MILQNQLGSTQQVHCCKKKLAYAHLSPLTASKKIIKRDHIGENPAVLIHLQTEGGYQRAVNHFSPGELPCKQFLSP